MEEKEISSISNQSTYCENGNCTKQYQHICRDHQKMLCNTCFIALHSNCRGEVNTKQQNTYECIQFVSNLLESMIEANKLLNIELHNNDFNEEIKSFRDDISLIKEKYIKASELNIVSELQALFNNIVRIQKMLIDSKAFTNYAKCAILNDAAKKNLNEYSNTDFSSTRSLSEEYKAKNEIRSGDSETTKYTHIEDEENFENNQTKQKPSINTNDDHISKGRISDMKLIQNSTTEDNRKQRISQERYLREKEKAKGKEILQIICSKHYGSLKEKINASTLTINCNQSNTKKFLKEIASAGLNSLTINKIRPCDIKDVDMNFKNILKYCFPCDLKLLCINTPSFTSDCVNMSYCINNIE